jgi:hypothetical protein
MVSLKLDLTIIPVPCSWLYIEFHPFFDFRSPDDLHNKVEHRASLEIFACSPSAVSSALAILLGAFPPQRLDRLTLCNIEPRPWDR